MIDLVTARAEALFASTLATGSHPTRAQVQTAIAETVRTRHGIRGCACVMAEAYGDHPDTAVTRMRWARNVVNGVYQPRREFDWYTGTAVAA